MALAPQNLTSNPYDNPLAFGPNLPPGLTLPPTGVGFPQMNTDVLTGNTNVPQLPTAAPTMTPEQFVAGIPGAPLQPGPLAPQAPGVPRSVGGLENQRAGLVNRLQGSSNQLLNQGTDQLALEQQAGISGMNKDIAALNEQIATRKAAFDTAIAGTATNTLGVESQTARISAQNRQKAVELGGLSSVLMAKQGNLEGAKAEIDRTLALKYDPIKQEIENTKMFLDLNYQDLSRADKKLADNLDRALTREKMAMDDFQFKQKTYADYLVKQGLDPLKALAANNIDELADLIGTTPSDISKGESTVSFVENIDGALSNKGGLSGAVGIRGIGRRELGRKGKVQTFIGTVEQLTGQLTVDKLIAAKGSGATFGALSDGERELLANSSTKLNSWKIKDETGKTIGFAVPEAEVIKELGKIKEWAKLDYQKKTGLPYPEEDVETTPIAAKITTAIAQNYTPSQALMAAISTDPTLNRQVQEAKAMGWSDIEITNWLISNQ